VLDACAKPIRFISDHAEHGDNLVKQRVKVLRAIVGELLLGLPPDELIRIELGRVGGQVFDVKPRVILTDRCDRIALVLGRLVPDQNHVVPKMTQQVAQEGCHVHLRDVVVEDLVIETETLLSGTHRDGRDDRQLVATIAMADHGRLATWRPGALQGRNEQEPGFVEEDQMCLQASGVFFTLGQRSRFQRCTASSLRSSARRSGFCTLQL